MKHDSDQLNEVNQLSDTGIKAASSKRPTKQIDKKPISMHEDVPVWCDCCSCEVEPYWLEAMQAADNKNS